MTRTFRNFHHTFQKGGKSYNQALENHLAGSRPGDFWRGHGLYDFRKAHVMHGRDGAISGEICGPHADGPNCFNTHDEVWGNQKRWAKKYTGRLRRIRDNNIIRDELRILDEDAE